MGSALRGGMVGRYLSFGPVLPPGNVVLQVFHLEIMRKLQQLLFLGTRRREIGVKKIGDTVLILEGSGQSWRLGVAEQVRRSSKEMQCGRMETSDAHREPGAVLEQEWAVPGWEAGASGQPGPLRVVLPGSPLWPPPLSVQSSSPLSQHTGEPQGQALLGGCPPSSGAPHSLETRPQGGQVGKLSLEDQSNCPGRGTTLSAGGKRLSHSQPATDSKTEPHVLGRTPEKTQPDPWILSDALGKKHAKPLHTPRDMEDTPARPSLTVG